MRSLSLSELQEGFPSDRLVLGTGCAKSGTGWLASVLGCGHEKQFNPRRHGPLNKRDVSWLAVPFLYDLPPETDIIRVIRNPYDVVRSIIKVEFLKERKGTRYEVFVGKHNPFIVKGSDHLTRAIRYAALWDLGIEKFDSHYYIQPDKEPTEKVHVTKSSIVPPSVEKLDSHPEGWRIRERAERWGYR